MPVLSGHMEVHIRGEYLSQKVEVVQWYRLAGVAFATATVLGVLEAYWNDIKTAWRAFHIDSGADRTLTLFGREPGLGGAYAELAIPSGEQAGTRVDAGATQLLPPTNCVGIKLTVGSGATRPGQKRPWGLWESDQQNGVLTGGIIAAAEDLAELFSVGRALGAPVAAGTMYPEIVRYDAVTGVIVASQDVVGHVVRTQVSTQNSRKFGHGS